MDLVFGTLFALVGLVLLLRPTQASEYIEKRQLGGPGKSGRRTPDWVMMLLGVAFVVVGGLAAVGQWPPG